jgi:hypothetical protein
MSGFRNCGLMFVVLAMAACQKSATEERNEAVNAQREATETAQQAANDRQKEVAEANQEAAKDIADTRREARERSLEAVESEIQRTSGAQARANEEVAEANRAVDGTRGEFAADARKRLDEIDEEARELRQKLGGSSAKDLPANTATRLDQIERDSKGMRAELSRLGGGSPESVQSVQNDLDRRLKATEKALDDLDD